MSDGRIEVFLSRPNWAPPVIEKRIEPLYSELSSLGFHVNTVGKTHAPLKSPFEEMRELMRNCHCAIVLGLPLIFANDAKVQHDGETRRLVLSTEWNQIEATAALMLGLPTLMLLHKSVEPRGIFVRGAADLFIRQFDSLESDWISGVRPSLAALRNARPSSPLRS